MFLSLTRWIDRNVLELGREMRLSYLPPLMVYVAAGVSSLTGIVGTFFVKDYLNLSAAFLATLGFWVVIPWSLKMGLGHIVDLLWRFKSGLLFVGASLIAASLLIMVGLVSHRDAMAGIFSVEVWFVVSALLAPIGYVLQDAVADAMTVEAVPHIDEQGQAIEPERLKLMHTTMQTLGRVAIIGGSVFVALLNIYAFSGVQHLSEAEKLTRYAQVYTLALGIPLISVAGVAVAAWLHTRDTRRLIEQGFTKAQAHAALNAHIELVSPNWTILLGSLVFVAFTLTMGLSRVKYGQEIIFVGSMTIIIFLMSN